MANNMSLPPSLSNAVSTSPTPSSTQPPLTTTPIFWRNRQVLFPITESRLRLQFVEGLRELMIDNNRFETALLLDSRKPPNIERHALTDGIPIGIAGAIVLTGSKIYLKRVSPLLTLTTVLLGCYAMPYIYTTGIQSRLIDHYGKLIDTSFQTIQDSPELVKAADQRLQEIEGKLQQRY